MPTVKPEILRWARETAGLTVGRAVVALGLRDNKKARAVDRLEALEAGAQEPSRALILKMAQKYRRPLLAFYLDAPPARGDRGEDFRSLPNKQTDTEGLLDALLRDVRARQATVRDILLEDDAHQRIGFIGSASMEGGVAPVLAGIRKAIRLDVGEYRAQASPESAFALLRSRAEEAGVFVLLIGNLGSHHSNIDVETFRGFALADEVAPFIVINDQDAVAAWSFTLLHELAHLWLGKTGVSGRSSEVQIEKFCNEVAAEFLLPASELATVGVGRNSTAQDAINLIEDFASERHLSRSMVAYSLYRAALLREETWKTISAWFLSQWRKARDAKRERQREGKGPNYYVVRRHRLGPALLQLIARSIDEGALTPTRASKVLGVKPRSVAPLLLPIDPSSGRAA
jgi:Zn-dependent peptidase ImmA (M78 family)